MSVPGLRAFLQNTVELERWPLVDVDVGQVTLLSHCEVLAVGRHSDGAHTVAILTVVGIVLLCEHVVGLVLVTSHVDDFVGVQEVQVVTLH